jgi:hypothetical protein
MKWLALVLLLVGGVFAVSRAVEGPDLTCPGEGTTAFRDASYGFRTPDDAVGTLLDDADHVTQESDGAEGLETVAYRGYDADGELRSVVAVEGTDSGWIASRVDTCR